MKQTMRQKCGAMRIAQPRDEWQMRVHDREQKEHNQSSSKYLYGPWH